MLKFKVMILLVLMFTMVACSKETVQVETHKLEKEELEPIAFSGSIKDTSQDELIKLGREVVALSYKANTLQTQAELDKLSDYVLEEKTIKRRFTLKDREQVFKLKIGSAKVVDVKTEVSNESVIIHESMDTFEYHFDFKSIAIMEDGSKKTYDESPPGVSYEIYKADNNTLKIIKITADEEKWGS